MRLKSCTVNGRLFTSRHVVYLLENISHVGLGVTGADPGFV